MGNLQHLPQQFLPRGARTDEVITNQAIAQQPLDGLPASQPCTHRALAGAAVVPGHEVARASVEQRQAVVHRHVGHGKHDDEHVQVPGHPQSADVGEARTHGRRQQHDRNILG
jgi:hypothetical protein